MRRMKFRHLLQWNSICVIDLMYQIPLLSLTLPRFDIPCAVLRSCPLGNNQHVVEGTSKLTIHATLGSFHTSTSQKLGPSHRTVFDDRKRADLLTILSRAMTLQSLKRDAHLQLWFLVALNRCSRAWCSDFSAGVNGRSRFHIQSLAHTEPGSPLNHSP